MLSLLAALLALGTPTPQQKFWVSIADDAQGACETIVSGRKVADDDLPASVRGRRSIDVMVNADVDYACVAKVVAILDRAGVAHVGLVPVLPEVILTVGRGPCRLVIDGKPVSFADLQRQARQWAREAAEVHFVPDPEAAYACVERVVRVLRQEHIGKLGFVGKEVPEPNIAE